MDIGWKVASAASLAGAGLVANLVINAGWKLVTGHKPPQDGEEAAQSSLLEVVLFAAISGVAVSLIQRAAMRRTNSWYGGRHKDVLDLGN